VQKTKEILDKELLLRAELKHLYDQFILDAQDKVSARRYAQQAYFGIQKKRFRKLMAERLEFHPFWGANPFSSQEEMDEFTGGDDDSDE
jgi:hypothetical protein